jgi:hypothetical protein
LITQSQPDEALGPELMALAKRAGAKERPKTVEVEEDRRDRSITPEELNLLVAAANGKLVPQTGYVYTPSEISELNAKHAVISNLGGKCVIMEYVPSIVAPGTLDVSYQAFTAFKERYQNRYIETANSRGRMDSEPLAPFWLQHPKRRQYEGLDLVANGPQVLPGNVLNLWSGFGVKPKPGDWKLLRRHVGEVLADGNKEFEDYILGWTAWVHQNPGERAEVVLVVRGGKGSGKGVWGHVMMKTFGQHALQVFNPEHLSGKHNAHLQNKLFVFADEAFWAGDKTAERVLKGIVTERVMMIEPKGINAFQWPNRISMYMAANDKWVVPASHDERRYAVNNVSEKWKQNKDYFGPLFAEIAGGGVEAMLWDLQRENLGNWHPRDNIPRTRALLEQKMLSLTGLEQWWVAMASSGDKPRGQKNNPRHVLSTVLLAAAKAHNRRNEFLNETELGNFMREMGCTHKSNGKAWGWIFPPLPEVRSAWLAKSGGHWEWLEPDLDDWGQKPEGKTGD